ncbi:MAG: acyltransferase, partial [bacterium]
MNVLFRKILTGIAMLSALPFYLIFRIKGIFIGKQRAFAGSSQVVSLFPGIIGQFLRRGFYVLTLKKCSSLSTIDFGTFFPSSNMIIGNHVYIGAYCIISECVIEDDVIIGSGVHLANKDMHHFSSLDKPIRLQGGKRQQIRIGKDSWLGNKAVIMADVGSQCVIGAGSGVVKPVEDRSV